MEENKALDDFIRKTISEVGLESPSTDFNDLIWEKIERETTENTTYVHQPLFSKTTWFCFGAVFTSIFIYAIIGNYEKSHIWFSLINLNRFTSLNIGSVLSKMEISNLYVYGILILTLSVICQVFIIKKRHDKQYRLP